MYLLADPNDIYLSNNIHLGVHIHRRSNIRNYAAGTINHANAVRALLTYPGLTIIAAAPDRLKIYKAYIRTIVSYAVLTKFYMS